MTEIPIVSAKSYFSSLSPHSLHLKFMPTDQTPNLILKYSNRAKQKVLVQRGQLIENLESLPVSINVFKMKENLDLLFVRQFSVTKNIMNTSLWLSQHFLRIAKPQENIIISNDASIVRCCKNL